MLFTDVEVKEKKPRKVSPTNELAYWFVTEYLKRPFNSYGDGQHLKHAKLLVNPGKEHPEKFPSEKVKATLKAMSAGLFPDWPKGKTASVLLAVLWGNPRYIDRPISTPPKPPYYETIALQQWERDYGSFVT
jgi:hypothetical protein